MLNENSIVLIPPNNVDIIKHLKNETVKEKNTRTTWKQTVNST